MTPASAFCLKGLPGPRAFSPSARACFPQVCAWAANVLNVNIIHAPQWLEMNNFITVNWPTIWDFAQKQTKFLVSEPESSP